MTTGQKKFFHHLAVFAGLSLLGLAAALASPIADWLIVENLHTQNPEAVWSSVPQDGGHAEIYYSVLDGSSWAPSTALTASEYDNVRPVLGFDSTGARIVVWETGEAVPRILMRVLPAGAGTWNDPVQISDPDESATYPSMAVSGGTIWITYEAISATGERTLRAGKTDVGGHVDRSTIAATIQREPLGSLAHAEGGKVWADWVESSSTLAYAVLGDDGWGSLMHEALSGVQDGRERIRSHVMEP